MISISDKDFETLVGYMHQTFGINLQKKRNLIEGRLGGHVAEQGFADYGAYISHVLSDTSGQRLTELVNRLTTNHTFFLREAAHFDLLKRQILPQLVRSAKNKEIRTWSAGCSSGEEPYTLAMVLHDYFGTQKALWDTRILATDISRKVLDKARQGRYPAQAREMLPESWQQRYIRDLGTGEIELVPKIREDVVFRSLNLIQDRYPLKGRFHLIFCRNVMIYFDKPTKRELVHRLYNLTEPGGYLMIGHAESIGREDTDYCYVQPAVYQKPCR